MGQNPKIRHRPRQARVGPYNKINAYSHSPSKQQILTFLFFIIQVALHQVFISPQIPDINEPILWILFGFRYLLILVLAYDYIWLTIMDPVDTLILKPDRKYKFKDYELRQCSLCNSTVQRSSHHCMTCNRCTEDFDHHCKYLNNCIGVRNYEQFLRLLAIYVLFNLLSIGVATWVLVSDAGGVILLRTYEKWVIVGYLVFSSLLLLAVASLMGFHMWISCCANMTTLEYIYQGPVGGTGNAELKDHHKHEDKENPVATKKDNSYAITIEPAPLSADYFIKSYEERKNQDPRDKRGIQLVPRSLSPTESRDQPDTDQPMEYYRK